MHLIFTCNEVYIFMYNGQSMARVCFLQLNIKRKLNYPLVYFIIINVMMLSTTTGKKSQKKKKEKNAKKKGKKIKQ